VIKKYLIALCYVIKLIRGNLIRLHPFKPASREKPPKATSEARFLVLVLFLFFVCSHRPAFCNQASVKQQREGRSFALMLNAITNAE